MAAVSHSLILCIVIVTSSTVIKGDEWAEIQIPEKRNPHTYIDMFTDFSSVSQQMHNFESFRAPEDLKKVGKEFSSFLWNPEHWIENTDGSLGSMFTPEVLMSALAAVANQTSFPCVNDTGRLLVSMFSSSNTTKWAKQFLDATGKPGPGISTGRFNFVGDYKLCRASKAPPLTNDSSSGFNGNYCVLQAGLGPPNILNPIMVQLGACMPDTCTEMENTLFVYEAIQKLGLNGSLSVRMAECRTDEREMTAATVVSIVVVCIIVGLMVAGTALDVVVYQWPKWQEKRAEESAFLTNAVIGSPEANGYTSIEEQNGGTSDETTGLLGKPSDKRPRQSICTKVLLAFSVYTNGSKVLNTHQPPGSLGSIHGIRFLSMCWVILGHTYVFGIAYYSNIGSQFAVFLKRWTFDAISNAFLSVDTFFTLSGLLTAYLTVKEMKKRGWKLNWGLFYFHRFWRLTPPYMLTLLLVLGFQQYLGSGALWSNLQPADKDNCENYWWANLLYVNNLVDSQYMCFGHSWYLSNDMQFFIISPFMLLPLYFHKYVGLLTCLGFCLITWITTGVLSHNHHWPATLISADPEAAAGLARYGSEYYVKPYTRIGPYIVGLVAGYWLALTNRKFGLSRITAAAGWAVATAVALATLYGLHGDISGEHVNNVDVHALYNALGRSAWGACVCWVIIACAAGYGGPVNKLLSWSPFVTLGRLTYMAYLIHPCLIYIYFQNQEQLYYISDINIVVSFCGIIVCTFMIAFVLMLGLESPMIGLEKVFLHKNRKE